VDVIDDIAKDFRLGVVQKTWSPSANLADDTDTRRAAKTLLDLYAYLQKATDRGVEMPMPITGPVRKQ
jgi:hypothetical protein